MWKIASIVTLFASISYFGPQVVTSRPMSQDDAALAVLDPQEAAEFIVLTPEPSSSDVARSKILSAARKYVGTPYGTSEGHIVCNWLIVQACADAGYPVHLALARDIWLGWPKVDDTEVADVLCFTHNGRTCGHVGMSNGEPDSMIHASSSKGVIEQNYVVTPSGHRLTYWKPKEMGAVKIPSIPAGG